MSVAETKFELCRNVEQVLKIGRDFQSKDSWRGEQHDTAKLLCDTIEYLRDQLNAPVGNSAAMREALTKVKEWMEHRIATCGFEFSATIPTMLEDVVLPALAAPPRNCDVGTFNEQQERFAKFCKSHTDAHECGIGYSIGHEKAKCPAYKTTDCSLVWAQMPYEAAKEGGAK